MGSQSIVIKGHTIFIPDCYKKVDSMPEDPENSIPYMVRTDHAACLALIFPVDSSESLPRTKVSLIEGIRTFMSENQGLIQAETYEDRVFSIVKTMKKISGVIYTLNYQKFYPDFILNIRAFFEETGSTGFRDCVVFELCRRQNLVGSDENPLEGWTKDPYDATIRNGALMNISENEKYDRLFPGHPLTMCREFLRELNQDIR